MAEAKTVHELSKMYLQKLSRKTENYPVMTNLGNYNHPLGGPEYD